MKKSTCIQLAVITAALASCKSPSYNRTNQYTSQDYNDSTYITETECCIYPELYPSIYDNYAQFFFNNFSFQFYYGNNYYLNPVPLHPLPPYIRFHYIIRGGFGRSGRSVSA